MAVENWSDDAVWVDLPNEAELEGELQKIAGWVRGRADRSVVLDFSNITAFNSRCLVLLLQIRTALEICGHHLILSKMAETTRGILSVTGLARIFETASDVSEARATLRARQCRSIQETDPNRSD